MAADGNIVLSEKSNTSPNASSAGVAENSNTASLNADPDRELKKKVIRDLIVYESRRQKTTTLYETFGGLTTIALEKSTFESEHLRRELNGETPLADGLDLATKIPGPVGDAATAGYFLVSKKIELGQMRAQKLLIIENFF